MSTSIYFKMVGPLAALCLLVMQLEPNQVNCFSTQSASRSSGFGRFSSQRAHESADYQQQHGDETGGEYTNNYIMAIEDQSTQPAGLMVSTTDHNYAIQSPRLGEFDWLGLTVNGAQVFILTKDNRTLSANLFALTEGERDFISEVRAKFTENLAGLRFAYYTSGSSLALSGTANQKLARPSTGGGHYPAAAATATATESLGNHEHQSAASSAISYLNNVNLASLQEQRRRHFARGLPEPTGNGSSEAVVRYSLAAAPASYEKRSRVGAPPPARARHYSPLEHKYARTRAFEGGRMKNEHAAARHSGGSYRIVDQRVGKVSSLSHYTPETKKTPHTKFSKCSFQHLVNLNYYNLDQQARKLNRTLAGDIYYFDFYCNILDVYSSTVSVRRQPDTSILYRDHRYFSYSRSQLPLEINRLFLAGDQVFFVYNDGSLLLRQSWMLDPAELDLVLGVRQELKGLAEWQDRAAGLLEKATSGGSTTPAPKEATTETPATPDS